MRWGRRVGGGWHVRVVRGGKTERCVIREYACGKLGVSVVREQCVSYLFVVLNSPRSRGRVSCHDERSNREERCCKTD